MPLYNKEKYVDESIMSVLNQTYENFELIIIDDCSTDSSLEIAKTYLSDGRVVILNNEYNSGVAITRNRGIKYSKGKYVAFIDPDDIWKPNKIEKQINLIESSNADIVYSSYNIVNERGILIKPFVVPETITYKTMLHNNVIGCSTVIVRRNLLDQTCIFNPKAYHEDYVLWMLLLKNGATAKGETDILVDYQLATGNRSANKINAAYQRWKIYRNELNCSMIVSIVSFVLYAFEGVQKYYFNKKY